MRRERQRWKKRVQEKTARQIGAEASEQVLEKLREGLGSEGNARCSKKTHPPDRPPVHMLMEEMEKEMGEGEDSMVSEIEEQLVKGPEGTTVQMSIDSTDEVDGLASSGI